MVGVTLGIYTAARFGLADSLTDDVERSPAGRRSRSASSSTTRATPGSRPARTEASSSRAEEIESGVGSNLGDGAFERNLLDMILGMLTAPVR